VTGQNNQTNGWLSQNPLQTVNVLEGGFRFLGNVIRKSEPDLGVLHREIKEIFPEYFM
jgi:hypothetical protein